MRHYFPDDSTGNLIMIKKLVLGEIWTGDLPIFNPDALTSANEGWSKESLELYLEEVFIQVNERHMFETSVIFFLQGCIIVQKKWRKINAETNGCDFEIIASI